MRNERRPVCFDQAVRGLLEEGYRFFVECSPHPVLTIGVEETAADTGVTDAVATGTLRRGEGGLESVLTSAAELFVRGAAVDWSAVTGTPDTPARSAPGHGSAATEVTLAQHPWHRRPRTRTDPGRRRAAPRRAGSAGCRPHLPGPRLRLRHGGGTPPSSELRHLAEPADERGVRPPDATGTGDGDRVEDDARRELRRRRRGTGARGDTTGGGRRHRHRRHELPPARRNTVAAGSVAPGHRRHRRHGQPSGRPRLGHGNVPRRIPPRRRCLRRGVLRHLAA
ncbi:hypothetical protein DI273_30700 [Streptomyces violascens]|nr:hypothetical protein DI273_30700 [Streptomyces violascens]